MRTFHRTAILLLAAATLTAGGLYASLDLSTPASSSLAIDAPPGALLAIESPDFATLLRSWNNSPEQRRWLAGDNYAAFSQDSSYQTTLMYNYLHPNDAGYAVLGRAFFGALQNWLL